MPHLAHFEKASEQLNHDRHHFNPYIPNHNCPYILTPPSPQSTHSHTDKQPDKDLPPTPLLDSKHISETRRYWLHLKFKARLSRPRLDLKAKLSRNTLKVKDLLPSKWLGPRTFPDLWMRVCKLWTIVALGALIMPLVVWIMIFIENTKTFADTMDHYLGNDQSRYDQIDGDSEAGYVGNTNIPKHLGGVIFAAGLDVAMWLIILISACADLFWRFPIAKQFIDAFYANGLYDEKGLVEIEFFFLVANAFLKLFIVVATGSQTYTGLYPDNNQVDTPLFCLYAVMILLCSIPFTLIALFYILHGIKRKEYAASAA
ncbi:hypothetical protein L198_07961 [Cryptococcus wingfieldii CBS 7118]|uniref:Uncharacterized protein n=1 Tax=Cryptococcus wingfieldii CBS 7118 TaxID=1295528 RepID=A0A1E3HRW9_9TREE|nr:hypothetical protein L198_07961 [Cryptococcus wingfieldii CBS 7118]ODN79077.1 hypothetical protein L198_07961 [Cryptococcus wingfieldii CBS 7118]